MAEEFSFGNWVRRRRKALDMTQGALAQQVGCALITIRRIEADERRPSLQLAQRLAHYLQLPDEERPLFLKVARAVLAPDQLSSPQISSAPALAQGPSATLTFLFTDIAGSMRLWEQHPEAMKHALARHDTILRQAIERRGGMVFKTVGDSFYAAFGTAPDALRAAVAAQRALHAAPWDATGPLKVRMALHTGVVELRDGDYFGPPLNRLARLLVAAHGGQLLLSDVSAGLVRDDLPPGVSLHDLGEHRLRDLARPLPVYQVLIAGLPADFPPLRTLDGGPAPAPPRSNLPRQLTSFVGRRHQLAELSQLVITSRLVTLLGAGGMGKTRLAIEVAGRLLDHFPGGVWLVELAALEDPALLEQTVANALGITEERDAALRTTLVEALSARPALLLLDNCEHLLSACLALVQRLLAACPELHILSTSREVCGVVGEVVYPLAPLALPQDAPLATPDDLYAYEAVGLFVERARALQPGFVLTADNAPAVVEICRKLDGLPLALELAAARVRLLPVEQLARLLDHRFQLLTDGNRMAQPRHRTLQALVDWSYQLLSAEEQALFRSLSVFAGGWTLEAASAVYRGVPHAEVSQRPAGLPAGPPGSAPVPAPGSQPIDLEVLQLLGQLVDKSLVLAQEQAPGGHPAARYQLLETLRQYAWARLVEQEQPPIGHLALRQRHLAYFLALAESSAHCLKGPDQLAWLERLDQEQDNLRAALAWALELPDVEPALRLSAALHQYWSLRGQLSEGRRWLEAALARDGGSSAARAAALYAAGLLAQFDDDSIRSETLLQQSLTRWTALGDAAGRASALFALGLLLLHHDAATDAEELFTEALGLFQSVGDGWGSALALDSLGGVAHRRGDSDRALSLKQQALELASALGDRSMCGGLLLSQGRVALARGDYADAQRLFEQSLGLLRELSLPLELASVLADLGDLALARQDTERALAFYQESLALQRGLGNPRKLSALLTRSGIAALRLGALAQASVYLSESLQLASSTQDRRLVASCYAGMAALALARAGDPDQVWTAAVLCGTVETLLVPTGRLLSVAEGAYEQSLATCRERLPPTALAEARAHGAALLAAQLASDQLAGEALLALPL